MIETIGATLKQARLENGLTIDEVSKITHISKTIISDIEAEKFEKYHRDELYIKNYIKRLAVYYRLDEQELLNSYLDITQEISLSEVKKKKEEKDIKREKESENSTISSNINDTLAEMKKVSTIKKQKRNRRVYRNNHIRDNIRYIVIAAVVVVLIVALFYGITKLSSKSADTNFNNVATPVIEDNTDTAATTDDGAVVDQTETPEEIPAQEPTVEYVKNSPLNYSIKLPEGTEKFTFKVVFVGRTWAALSVNGVNYSDFAQTIYNNDNTSNDLSDEGEPVEITFNTADFNELSLRLGYSQGHKFYVNDVELPTDQSDYNDSTANFILTLEK
ncbi:MAG: helix-turn-helix domain-containing protein [Erysipelotrichaceae bacterium]|nr:helix-turn-helix domain-containing protein [Erysipelotrichaceae bacterium]MDD3809949.1 helix-turn-helix domain-containing protein [Erysipelotrichaceae bacterium]